MWKVIVLAAGLLMYMGGEAGSPAYTAGMSPGIVHAAEAGQAHSSESSPQSYGSLNGITLTDRKQDVIRKLGTPVEVKRDAISGVTEFHYKDMEVGLRRGLTEYVHVKPSAKSFRVEDRSVGMTSAQIRKTLGKPYFKAEDGDVYLNDGYALKVFKNRETGQITGVDLFFDYLE